MTRSRWTTAAWCIGVTTICLLVAVAAGGTGTQAPADSDGWRIPLDAATEVNPEPASQATLDKGRKLYDAKCRRCHGADGQGRGPDADPDHPPANLTDPRRASRNPDGVMFYKIWNGRARPRMPAMKLDLTRAEVWTLVHYVKSLRR